MFPFSLRSRASHASSEFARVQPNRSLVPLPLRSKLTPSAGPVSAIPSPSTSITIGEPPHTSQPEQLHVMRSYSPPYMKHLLMAATLPHELDEEKQQRPEPFGLLPGGQ